MFGKKKKLPAVKASQASTSELLSRITSRTSKEINASDYEKEFFLAFENALRLAGLSVSIFSAERMSSGSIRVNCYPGMIGTVHLRKKFGSIQYLTSIYDVHDMNDAPLEAVIAVIPYWIAYSKEMMRNHKVATTV